MQLICLSVHKLKFKFKFLGGFCVTIVHFDYQRITVTEILMKIVWTGLRMINTAFSKYLANISETVHHRLHRTTKIEY